MADEIGTILLVAEWLKSDEARAELHQWIKNYPITHRSKTDLMTDVCHKMSAMVSCWAAR